MDDYQRLIKKALKSVNEIMPWDLEEKIPDPELILLDIREKDEFEMMHIQNSINIPRGVLESACVWNYEDTEPKLAKGRNQNIVLICRSGSRSVLAVLTMQQMGFQNVQSLKLGIKGWNDNDLKMIHISGSTVDVDEADKYLNQIISIEKRQPETAEQ